MKDLSQMTATEAMTAVQDALAAPRGRESVNLERIANALADIADVLERFEMMADEVFGMGDDGPDCDPDCSECRGGCAGCC